MPLPTPKKKEKKGDFVSRCISEVAKDPKFKDNKQRIAICYTQFDTAKASADVVIGSGDDEMLIFADAGQKSYQGQTRSELKDSDFLFPEKRSFPIVSPQDVRDAINNYGRMGGAMSYDEFIKKLYQKAKSKGPEFVAQIPESTKKEHKLSTAQEVNLNAPEMEEETPDQELLEYKKELYEMAVASIMSIKSHAEVVLGALNDLKVQENLTETWMQGKLAIAEDYMVNVHNYVMFNPEN